MNPEYKRLREEANQLWFRFKDQMDDKRAAESLFGEVRDIVEMFEMNKNPHSIEDRVKHLTEELRGLRNHGDGQEMDFSHIDEFVDDYEALRRKIRELSNY